MEEKLQEEKDKLKSVEAELIKLTTRFNTLGKKLSALSWRRSYRRRKTS